MEMASDLGSSWRPVNERFSCQCGYLFNRSFEPIAFGAGSISTLGVMKVRAVRTVEDAEELVAAVTQSAERALAEFARSAESKHGLQVLWSMKFSPIGCDPLNAETPLNLIEQINQTFTYLASAKAVNQLLALHPSLAPFTLNLGTSPGSDIESACGSLAAEVFAAVNTSNNRKLAKDRTKVSQTNAQFKYVFFMCPGYSPGRQPKSERESGVEVWSVGGEL